MMFNHVQTEMKSIWNRIETSQIHRETDYIYDKQDPKALEKRMVFSVMVLGPTEYPNGGKKIFDSLPDNICKHQSQMNYRPECKTILLPKENNIKTSS